MPLSMSFLKDELEQNRIATYIPELLGHQGTLAELGYALIPIIHEGKIQPYGFIIINNPNLPANTNLRAWPHLTLTEARWLADGCHSFSLFRDGDFKGILFLDQKAQNELQLVQLQQELKAVICTTDTSGITRVFCEEGVLIHQYRSLQRKPSVKSAIQNVLRCVPTFLLFSVLASIN